MKNSDLLVLSLRKLGVLVRDTDSELLCPADDSLALLRATARAAPYRKRRA